MNEILGLKSRIKGYAMYSLLANDVHCTVNGDNGTLFSVVSPVFVLNPVSNSMRRSILSHLSDVRGWAERGIVRTGRC